MKDTTPQDTYTIRPIGMVRSELKRREESPKQGHEGAPDAWLEIEPEFADGLDGITTGADILVLTWLHKSRRDILKLHPRNNPQIPLRGVFATRSPNRPNPIGLHPVTVRAVESRRIKVGPLEAIDGTPILDIKPVPGSGEKA